MWGMTETEWGMLAKPIKRIIERIDIDSREEEEMEDRELIELLAEALQESQWYMLLEDNFPPIYICPSCGETQGSSEYLDHRGAHSEGCIIDRAFTEFEEWKKAPYTKAVKVLQGK